MEKKLSNEIRDLQNKLNSDIQNNQIDNLETIGLSNKIDKLLMEEATLEDIFLHYYN